MIASSNSYNKAPGATPELVGEVPVRIMSNYDILSYSAEAHDFQKALKS